MNRYWFVRSLAFCGALVLAGLGSAFAQQLAVQDAQGNPGTIATLNVVLKSAPAGVAGANFTLTLPLGNTVANFDNSVADIVTMPGAVSAGWAAPQYNVVSTTELRAVLYNNQSPIQGWPAIDAAGAVIAQVKVRVLPGAAAGATAVVSVDNAVTPGVPGDPASIKIRKTAFSNTSGTSIGHAGGATDTVTVQPGTLTVVRPLPNTLFDFAQGGQDAIDNKSWMFIQGFPLLNVTNDGFCRLNGVAGLGIAPLFNSTPGNPLFYLSFAYWLSPVGMIDADMIAADNVILRTRFKIASNETDGDDAPRYRLRLNASDESYAFIAEVMSSSPALLATTGSGRLQPTAGNPLNFDMFVLPPSWVKNDIGPKGYTVNFDAVNINDQPIIHSPEGSTIFLESLEVKGAVIDPAAGTPTGVSFDFSTAGEDPLGWDNFPPADFDYISLVNAPNPFTTPPTVGTFKSPASSFILNGIGHRIDESEPTDVAASQYGHRLWRSPTFNLTPGQLYRANFTIVSPTNDPLTDNPLDPTKNPNWRLRVTAEGDFMWNIEYIVTRKINAGVIETDLAPTPEGKDYSFYFLVPTQLSPTAPLRFNFELVNLANHVTPNNDSNPFGAVMLQKVSIDAVPLPTF